MVEMYGMSGCTAELLDNLHRKGLRDIHFFPDILRFSREYSQPRPALQEMEEQRLRREIERLKVQEADCAARLKVKEAEREAALVKERATIPALIEASRARTRNPLKALWHLFRRAYLLWRLHALTDHLPAQVTRPFWQDRRAIRHLQKGQASLDAHFDAIVARRLRNGLRGKEYLNARRALLIGASGEEAVIKELGKLPAPFVVINDVHLALWRSVYWREGGEYVRSAQVDHVVIGPGGVFLIETKNWRPSRTTSEGGWTPEHQIRRAGLIFYILTNERFWHKVPTRQLVVMTHECPITRGDFVTRLPLSALVEHLRRAKLCLMRDEIRKITKWLL